MSDTLFTLWFLLTCSDAIAEVLAVVLILRTRSRFGRYIAWLLAGFAVESIFAAASLILFFPNELSVAPAFAISRSIGRGFKAVMAWVLVGYLVGICNGVHHTEGPVRK